MAQWRRWLRLLILCGVLLVVYFVIPVTRHLPTRDYVARGVAAVVFFALLGYLVVRQLRLQLDDDTGRRLDGLVVVVLAVVLGFALAFYMLEDGNPGQIPGLSTKLDALYFAMTTLLTVGYGDIHAAGQTARAVVLVQMVFNVVFIASAANVVSGRVRTAMAQRAAIRAARSGHPPQRPPGQ
jgi:hypothetical protein